MKCGVLIIGAGAAGLQQHTFYNGCIKEERKKEICTSSYLKTEIKSSGYYGNEM